VSFTLGLFVGFCLGILCMVLLFQAKASDAPTNPILDKPEEQEQPPHRAMSPPETPSHRRVDR